MVKSTRFLKKLMALFLVVLMSIESFAAAVSDNDGSAFITKAEFDSLKNNFQSQIGQYNTSIDSKIDAAIASYLSGIKVETVTLLTNKLDRINASSLDGYMAGETLVPFGFRCMAKQFNPQTTQKPVGAILNFELINTGIVNNDNNTRAVFIARMGIDWESRAQLMDKVRPNETDYKIGKYFVCKKTDSGFAILNKISDVEYRYWVGGSWCGSVRSEREPRNSTQAGVFQWNAGTNTLDFENGNDFWGLNTKDFTQRWGPPENQRVDSLLKAVFGPAYSATETNIVVPIVGSISGSSVCIVNDDFYKMVLDEEVYADEFYGYQSLIRDTRKQNDMSVLVSNNMWNGINEYGKVKIRYNHHPIYEKELDTLFDDAVYEALNEEVRLYNGLPLFTSTDRGKVKFKIKFYNLSNNNVYIGLSKNRFNNDASGYVIDSSFNLRNQDGVKYNTHTFDSNKEYTFIIDVKKNETVWLKTYDPTDDYEYTGATITSDIELTTDS